MAFDVLRYQMQGFLWFTFRIHKFCRKVQNPQIFLKSSESTDFAEKFRIHRFCRKGQNPQIGAVSQKMSESTDFAGKFRIHRFCRKVQNLQILQKSSESTDRSGFAEISIVEVELWRQNLPGVHHPFDLRDERILRPIVSPEVIRLYAPDH